MYGIETVQKPACRVGFFLSIFFGIANQDECQASAF
jgi:hypothetical protein